MKNMQQVNRIVIIIGTLSIISGYCALNGIACLLDKAQKWGMAATKLSTANNVAIGKAYDANTAISILIILIF